MNRPSEGGSASIELSLEELRKIGGDTEDHASGATVARRAVSGTDGAHGLYSSYPAAQTFARHHDAVSRVFTETLQALHTEMQEFGQTIVNVVRRYEDTDEKVQTALAQIATRIKPAEGELSSTEQAYDQARHDQKDDLPERSDADDAADHGEGGQGDSGGRGDHGVAPKSA